MISAILGIDLGTGSIKAAVVARESGQILGLGSAEHATRYPEPNSAEQNPTDWWRGTIAAVRRARAAAGDVTIEAIGVTGQMHGAVLLDAANTPVHEAIIWADSRSASVATALMAEHGTEIIAIAGSPVAAGFQAATLRWLANRVAFRTVITPKDYLRLLLTGELATDPGDASGTLLFDIHRRDWSPELVELAGITRDQLPPVQAAHSPSGSLTREAASALGLPAGMPVFTGTGDAAAAALGAGAVGEEQLLITLSTGAQVLTPRFAPTVDSRGRLHTFASALEPSATAPGWYIMGATMVAGMALRWLRDSVFQLQSADSYEAITAGAASISPGAERLLFLPHLAGERSPGLDPFARGAFIGLNPAHDRDHLTRAVLEGVAFSLFDAYLAVKEVTGSAPGEIILAGGGARSALWGQIIADLFALPVRPLISAEQTVLGAAILAAGGDPVATAKRWAERGERIEPDADRSAIYQDLFAIYAEVNAALKPVFRKLAG